MISAKSLAAKGAISPKEMMKVRVLRGSKSQKSKMAPMMSKRKDEGAVSNKGIAQVRTGQINGPGQDKGGKFGTPSKGGRSGPEGQLHVNEINRADKQKPKFPAGGKAGAGGKVKNARSMAKTKQRSLPMYGKFGGRPA